MYVFLCWQWQLGACGVGYLCRTGILCVEPCFLCRTSMISVNVNKTQWYSFETHSGIKYIRLRRFHFTINVFFLQFASRGLKNSLEQVIMLLIYNFMIYLPWMHSCHGIQWDNLCTLNLCALLTWPTTCVFHRWRTKALKSLKCTEACVITQ